MKKTSSSHFKGCGSWDFLFLFFSFFLVLFFSGYLEPKVFLTNLMLLVNYKSGSQVVLLILHHSLQHCLHPVYGCSVFCDSRRKRESSSIGVKNWRDQKCIWLVLSGTQLNYCLYCSSGTAVVWIKYFTTHCGRTCI